MPQLGHLAGHAKAGLAMFRPVLAIVDEIGVAVDEPAVQEQPLAVRLRLGISEIGRDIHRVERRFHVPARDHATLADFRHRRAAPQPPLEHSISGRIVVQAPAEPMLSWVATIATPKPAVAPAVAPVAPRSPQLN